MKNKGYSRRIFLERCPSRDKFCLRFPIMHSHQHQTCKSHGSAGAYGVEAMISHRKSKIKPSPVSVTSPAWEEDQTEAPGIIACQCHWADAHA